MAIHLVKKDAEIQREVLQELTWDSRVGGSGIGVEVTDGVVSLSGVVHSYARKLAARDAAHRVGGVLDVADELRVVTQGAAGPSDAEIAESARAALQWHASVPDERIQTTVTDGWVTLTGDVTRWAEKADAEAALRNLYGVKGVTNNIYIRPQPTSAAAIQSAIETALRRRAAQESESISVQVDGATITLSGTVHDWAERNAIVAAASHAPGVQTIKNELRIDLFQP